MMEEKEKRKIPEITRMSSKGQVVIPKVFREAMKLTAGSPMAVDIQEGLLIMKPIRSPIEEEDIQVLQEVKEAWEEIERGAYKRLKAREFLREIRKW